MCACRPAPGPEAPPFLGSGALRFLTTPPSRCRPCRWPPGGVPAARFGPRRRRFRGRQPKSLSERFQRLTGTESFLKRRGPNRVTLKGEIESLLKCTIVEYQRVRRVILKVCRHLHSYLAELSNRDCNVCFRGQSGHGLAHRKCQLITHQRHYPRRTDAAHSGPRVSSKHENAPIQILDQTSKTTACGLARLIPSPACEFSNSQAAPLPRRSRAAPIRWSWLLPTQNVAGVVE